MTHPICASEGDRELSHFQRLWRTLLDPDVEPRTRLERLFETETEAFGLSHGFLSRIDLETETERFEIVHGSPGVLESDTAVPLSKTYCRKTIAAPEGTMAVSDALAEGWGDDPAYETFELESYLGTTVSVGEEFYGTLCFVAPTARDDPINDKEKALVELYGQWVAYTLARRDEPPFRGTRTDAIEGRAVSPEAIDAMMGTLKSRTRRDILVTLIDTDETSLSALERRFPDERDRVTLYHNHVPKLVDAGYVEWDTETDAISKGPRFSKAEPLVRLLKEYQAEFPE